MVPRKPTTYQKKSSELQGIVKNVQFDGLALFDVYSGRSAISMPLSS